MSSGVNSSRGVSPKIGQKFAGLYIPYGVHVDGRPFGRLRLDVPEADRKYTQRAGSGVHPYFPAMPGLDAQPDVVLVEGEFKAIALCEAGVRAIGISGFYGFAHEGAWCVRLSKHLEDHPAQRVLFLGDNDTALNFQFADAAVKLAVLAGAVPVVLPRIPLSMPKGVDDCRAHLGAEACGPTPAFAGTAGNVKADLEGIASKKPARSRSPRRTFEIRQKLRPVGITWPGECSRRRRSNRLPGPTGNRSLLVSCCRVPHRSSFFQGIA